MDLPFTVETELEARICADPEWVEGAAWGVPRPGHSEGMIMYHIAEVLANIDHLARSPKEREALRLIALIHDTFKNRVDTAKPRGGANHHAAIARTFAERYFDDQVVLDIIELHDEAFNSWRMGATHGRWREAEERADRLIARLGPNLPLYLDFYRADNATASKEADSLIWFEEFLHRRGFAMPSF